MYGPPDLTLWFPSYLCLGVRGVGGKCVCTPRNYTVAVGYRCSLYPQWYCHIALHGEGGRSLLLWKRVLCTAGAQWGKKQYTSLSMCSEWIVFPIPVPIVYRCLHPPQCPSHLSAPHGLGQWQLNCTNSYTCATAQTTVTVQPFKFLPTNSCVPQILPRDRSWKFLLVVQLHALFSIWALDCASTTIAGLQTWRRERKRLSGSPISAMMTCTISCLNWSRYA